MSKEGLIATLQAEISQDIEKCLQEAAIRIQILDESFARDRDDRLEKAKAKGRQLAEKEKEQLLENQQTLAEHERQNLMWQVLTKIVATVEENLGHARKEEESYPHLFERLLAESIAQLQKNNASLQQIEVQIDARDTDLFHSMKCELAVDLQSDLTTWGGMIVRDREGGVLIDNRLEARLERARSVFIQGWLAEVETLLQDEA
ncbi:MAG: V-type ATP synthase subunit E family protein [Anaerolineae bacterium]|jgi:vacuolar-type H+-ATPase subunit E/Vma4|nr:V-type ATP synthase subunit E family protein [Anaerolineae bacterium]